MSLLRSWSYVLIHPILALREANENPLLYAPVSVFLTLLAVLVSIETYDYFLTAALYLIPLLITYSLASRLYRVKVKTVSLLINYGLIQYVIIMMCIASRFGLLNLKGLIGAFSRSGLTVFYISYMFIFSRESYKLNNSQAFVITILTLFLLRMMLST